MYLAIDPGINGVFILMDKSFKIKGFWLMPTYEVKVGKKKQNHIHFEDVYKHFFCEPNFEKVYMEMPMAMRDQDVSSVARSFGNRQRVAGILQGLGNEIIDVYPSAWKRVLGITVSKEVQGYTQRKKIAKQMSIELAERYRDQYSPGFDFVMPRCRVAHDGVAEAYLIGIYGLTRKI